jgi:FAD/FMN-containing dehydrogenase
MTGTLSDDLDVLRAALGGDLVVAGDPAYDGARAVWNAAVDRRPAAIARCASAADVTAALRSARERGLEVAVRAGGHSVPGWSTCDDGLVVDVTRMNRIEVDPVARRAVVGGGALIKDVDAATQAHGLAVPLGLVGHTGVAGLTLGGGMGWLTRRAGLTVDNLLSAQVVLADGQVVRAAEDENPDLFWAIRGGGGNFGVVTEFEFRLHEAGPMVQFGMFFWPLHQGRDALRLMREVVADLPPTMNAIPAAVNAPPEPFVPAEHRLEPGFALLLVGFDDPAEHAAVAERVRTALPPLFEMVTPMPYTALQQTLDEANAWGFSAYEKSGYFADLTDDVVDLLVEHVPHKISPLSAVLFYRLDGAYCTPAEDATAFGGRRTPRYSAFFVGLCPSPEMLPAEREWVRTLWSALRPHMIDEGGYVNGTDGPAEDSYGAKYRRLVELKAVYDPGNTFHRNVNIT